MPKIQIFYDYECPFCKGGYKTLLELLPEYPDIDVEWRPIESHPRPENHPPHTDLCIEAFYIARELDADMDDFHVRMFKAAASERQNVERPEVLCEILNGLMLSKNHGVLDIAEFRRILDSGKYTPKVEENNDLAYGKEGVWFVPAFRAHTPLHKIKLDAKGGIGVSKKELKDFLDKVYSC